MKQLLSENLIWKILFHLKFFDTFLYFRICHRPIKCIKKHRFFFDLMMIWYRDVLYFKATGDVNGLIFKDEVYDIKRQAEKSSYNGINSILEALRKAQIRLDANVNFDLVIELLLLTIKEN